MNPLFLLIFLNLIFSSVLANDHTIQGKVVNFESQGLDSTKIFRHVHDNLDAKISQLKPLQEPISIKTFFFDINGDGKEELFVYFDDHLFCGTKGCTTKIIDISGGRATVLLDTNTYQKIYIFNEKTNGYNNLGIGGDKETHIKPDIVILYWNGAQYSPLHNSKTK